MSKHHQVISSPNVSLTRMMTDSEDRDRHFPAVTLSLNNTSNITPIANDELEEHQLEEVQSKAQK